jgi:hypothetical protein
MNVSRHAGTMIKSVAIWTGMAVAVLCILLAAIGFFVTALFICIARHLGTAEAAAVTGAALLLLGAVIAFVGGALLRSLRRRQPSLLSELGGTVGLATRLVAMMVRRDPKKAVIISLVAGALAEYITTERKR